MTRAGLNRPRNARRPWMALLLALVLAVQTGLMGLVMGNRAAWAATGLPFAVLEQGLCQAGPAGKADGPLKAIALPDCCGMGCALTGGALMPPIPAIHPAPTVVRSDRPLPVQGEPTQPGHPGGQGIRGPPPAI